VHAIRQPVPPATSSPQIQVPGAPVPAGDLNWQAAKTDNSGFRLSSL